MTIPFAAEIAGILRQSSLVPPQALRLAQSLESEPQIFLIREAVEILYASKDIGALFEIAKVLVSAELLAVLGDRQIGLLRAAVRDSFREQRSDALMRAIVRHLANAQKAWIDYGTMHRWQGKYWKARRCFLLGLQLEGDNAIIFPQLAAACLRLARPDEAETWAKAANGGK